MFLIICLSWQVYWWRHVTDCLCIFYEIWCCIQKFSIIYSNKMQERYLNVKLLFSKSGSKLLIIAKSINLSSHIFCFNFCGTTAEIGVGQEECPLSHCLAVYSLSDLLTSLKVIPESVSPPKLRGPRFCPRRREQLWPLILPVSASPIMCPPADLTSDLFFKTLILFTQFTQLFFLFTTTFGLGIILQKSVPCSREFLMTSFN